ncbi:MAG: GWxTD domain-containing protein [Acidobacteriota bacterium]
MHYQFFSKTFARRLVILLSLTLLLPPLTAFGQKKKDKKQGRESVDAVYKRWLDEDVRWIINDEERNIFKALKTDDEREQFIEQFWLRRDPDPDTDVNEYREDYYQRIAYANEHFTSGIPGWRTDRGRIYVMFGPPDEKESHPSGGSYDRPTWEGGGSTSTYPFEIWWYRHLESVGSDVEIEFVDPSGSGEYRIARDPSEKDALLYVPNAGLTLAEQLGLSDKSQRVAFGGSGQGQMFGQRAKDQPFERLDLLSKLSRPPRVKFNDLAALASESDLPRATFDILDFGLIVNYLRVTESSVITSFTLQLENQDLVYRNIGGLEIATANVYAKISSVAGRKAGQFEDVVSSSYASEALPIGQQLRSVYQKNLVLPPGTYKIDLVVRDVVSGKTGVMKQGFVVPRYPEGELTTSSLILATKLEPLNGRMPTGQFVLGSMKVIPNATGVFKQDQTMGIYMQVYNVAIDQATLRPSVDIEYIVSQKDKQILRVKEDGKGGFSTLNSQQITLARLMSLKELKPGFYDLSVQITDQVKGTTMTTPKEAFQIVEGTLTASK